MECTDGVCELPVRGSRSQSSSSISKLFLLLISIIIWLTLMDMSIGRLRYHYLLSVTLSPVKREIQLETYKYHGDIPEELQRCRAYDRDSNRFVENCTLSACEQNAILLSQRRQSILNSVRDSHPSSRMISELFDGARGVDQASKIEKLFGRKSCEGVISSSDKTNIYVDLFAVVMLVVGLFIFLKFAKLVLSWRYKMVNKVD